MIILATIEAIRQHLKTWPIQQRMAFVPTMGNLHAGHIALVNRAKEIADKVVVSIFVNPLQFGPQEDFQCYPRTLATDLAQLAPLAVDVVFAPTVDEFYQSNCLQTQVSVPELATDLCGITRPQLFNGVTTVVSKLFHIIQPDIALFGEKDYQQFIIIQQMVTDLNFPLTLLAIPTVRQADGLALSSRNQYLTTSQRKIAPALYAILKGVSVQIQQGCHDYAILIEKSTQQLLAASFNRVDYVAIRTRNHLKEPQSGDTQLIVLAAVFLQKTRLIDNISVNLS